MNGFRMTKSVGFVTAIMNAIVRELKLGNFMLQEDIFTPARFREGTPDCTVEGITDTGRRVTAQMRLSWSDDTPRGELVGSAGLTFGYNEEGNPTPNIFRQMVAMYSVEKGVVLLAR